MQQHIMQDGAARIRIPHPLTGHDLIDSGPSKSGRPCLHPLCSPAGIVLTEDAPAHHPWQHGIYTGLNDVNGIGFWCEGLIPDRSATDGTWAGTASRLVAEAPAAWESTGAWRDPAGRTVLHETQAWRVQRCDSLLVLDLAWRLRAEPAVRFGQSEYGGLFVRMPWRAGMEVDLAGSAGRGSREQLDGRPAWWLAVALPLGAEGSYAGLALGVLAEHAPYPPAWRLDHNYGFSPSRCRGGAWSLPAGATHCERLRLVAFDGRIDVDQLQACFAPSS